MVLYAKMLSLLITGDLNVHGCRPAIFICHLCFYTTPFEGSLPDSLLLVRSGKSMYELHMEDEKAPLKLFPDKIKLVNLMHISG